MGGINSFSPVSFRQSSSEQQANSAHWLCHCGANGRTIILRLSTLFLSCRTFFQCGIGDSLQDCSSLGGHADSQQISQVRRQGTEHITCLSPLPGSEHSSHQVLPLLGCQWMSPVEGEGGRSAAVISAFSCIHKQEQLLKKNWSTTAHTHMLVYTHRLFLFSR